MKLFKTYNLSGYELKNRIVMAPMTRCRATGNIPNDLMAEYYAMRADAGLLITEGIAPSANGLGYARIPGLFTEEQIEGWRKVTKAVGKKGGVIFAQLMHTGRVSHPANMEKGAKIVAPSKVGMTGEMWTDEKGMQPYPLPKKMTKKDIAQAQDEFVEAAKNAIKAGFHGVELHGANGYLIDQFINPASNQRTDDYGGSWQNRGRFALEVAEKVAAAINPGRLGIRLSPYGAYNDMAQIPDVNETFGNIAAGMGKLGLAYIHIVDHASQGAPTVPDSIKKIIGKAFGSTIILSGGFNKKRAEAVLSNNKGNLVAFGRPYLANPDLVRRYYEDLPLNEPNPDTFYTPGPEGYIDYPLAEAVAGEA